MATYRLTLRALEDIKNIGRYTEQQWGKAQRNRYLRDLQQRLAWLADSPSLGKPRPDVAPGYHSFPQGQHVVFYLVRNDGIDVIGIPHKDMDIITYFPGD